MYIRQEEKEIWDKETKIERELWEKMRKEDLEI